METKIPPKKAIDILQARLKDIDALNFKPQVWKSRTENDIQEIFPDTTKWLQIRQINFDIALPNAKERVLAEGKDTARKLISSLIEFIDEYSKIAQQKKQILEEELSKKHMALKREFNSLAEEHITLMKEHSTKLKYIEELLDENEANVNEIERVRSETLQLDNVSLSKLVKAFLNLPLGQICAIGAGFIAIIGVVFSLGTQYQKNEANNEMFELKTDNNNLKNEIDIKNQTILDKDKKIDSLELIHSYEN